jgi:hypothetical protein
MIKNNILKLIAVTLTASAIMVACKKDDNPAPNKANKLLFNWKITNITTPKASQPETDSTLYKACMSDDVIKFTSTGFDFQDGTTKCDSTIFNYSKGNWGYKIASDSIQLDATTPAKYTSWKVITLNDSILKVRYIDSANPAKKITKTISFKH